MTAKVQSDIHDAVRKSLAGQDVRYTRGRRQVITSLQAANGPRSAGELFEATASVPLSSLYRSLTVLDEAGVLRRHHDVDGLARYELAEWLSGHHHHAVCAECGTVEDIELTQAQENALHTMVSSLTRATDWELSGHSLEVEGRCGRCRK
jgi:Fe2+ or Zn2+ uptake regulation protein